MAPVSAKVNQWGWWSEAMKATDKRYSQNIHYYSDFVPEALVQLVKEQTTKSLLDLGCGDGATLFALKKRGFLKDKNVFAVDISEERIAKTQKIDKKFRCFVADACALSKVVKKDSLNLVISSQVIEHVEDSRQFIHQVRRALKPKGYFYLSTVFKKWYAWFFYKNHQGKWVLDPTHLREYQSEEELLPLLEEQGFKIIDSQKILWKFPLSDFFLKRLGFGSNVYQRNRLLKTLRFVKVPILGYYYWEIICQKI